MFCSANDECSCTSRDGLLKVDVDLVVIPRYCHGSEGPSVIRLPRDAFHIFDNGNPEVIRSLSSQDAPNFVRDKF